ncbi:MAG: TolC family protein [Phycisphaerae bacterium]|nr:TolC family protein [Phycisphaerae bacterium]
MNMIRKKVMRYSFGVIVTFLLAGCADTDKLYKEVTLSRETAYRKWETRKRQEEQIQPIIKGKLSIQDSLKLTLTNNKVLHRILQEKEVARGQRLKSYSAIMPKVSLTADYKRLDEVTSFDIDTPTGKSSVQFGDVDNYTVGLTVTQPIFAGGSIPARINAARLFSLLTDENVREAIQELVYTAQYAYHDVLLSQHLVEISSDAVRSAKAHLDSVKQKQQGGIASDFDVLRAEVELSNFQAEFIQNKNAIDIAKANLVKVMGVSQDSDFVLSDELEYIPLNVTMEQAVEAAYRNRPDLYSREFDIKYQKELLKIIHSQYWPAINAYYTNTWSKPDPHSMMQIEWGRAWQAGVMASLPIFDGFAREGDIIAQKARLKQAQVDLIDAEETALFELTKAQLSIQNAKEYVESQRLNLTRAQEGLRLAEVGYKEGANTQVEMIDAQAALTTARVNYYQAIYSHIIAKLYLQKAMGTITTFGAAESKVQTKNPESGTAGEKSLAASVETE